MSTVKPKPSEVADTLVRRAKEVAADLEVNEEDQVLTVILYFQPGSTEQYARAERKCRELLSHVHVVAPGTVWGTDSGSVGGHAGLTQGYCRLSKSGVSKRELTATKKRVEA